MTTPVRTFVAAIFSVVFATVASAQPPIDRDPAEMIKRADTDGDGKVSRDEFIKAQTARLEAMFARMDADGDGKLSPEEFAESRKRMREAMPRDGQRPRGPGNAGRPERGERGAEEGFRKPPQQD
jgi:hypothetical protein